jgi:hypothetical protein
MRWVELELYDSPTPYLQVHGSTQNVSRQTRQPTNSQKSENTERRYTYGMGRGGWAEPQLRGI